MRFLLKKDSSFWGLVTQTLRPWISLGDCCPQIT